MSDSFEFGKNLSSASSELGKPEVSSLTIDDSVNEFDDIFSDMKYGDENFEYSSLTAEEKESPETSKSIDIPIVLTTDECVEMALNDFIDTPYESSYYNPEVATKVMDIVEGTFEEAREVALEAKEGKLYGRFFTDHRREHVEMVASKSLEAGDAIIEAIENGGFAGETNSERIAFSTNIDKKTLEGAGLSHDTGMKGGGYAVFRDDSGEYIASKYNNNNFDEIRKNHALNSAINMLANRDKYIEAGYTSDQVDKMAAECMAHSKSSSGIKDLSNRSQWSDCFDRIDAVVEVYNAEHDEKIGFNRYIFEENDSNLSSLATEAYALRVGDVSRDSHPDAVSQSGENIHVDILLLSRGDTWSEEISNPECVTIGENGEIVESDLSRRIHAGEQNIIENHTYADDEGRIIHEVTVSDGNVVPLSTQAALEDHVAELRTASDAECVVYVTFESLCDEEAMDKYEAFARNMFNEYGIDVVYSWNSEV